VIRPQHKGSTEPRPRRGIRLMLPLATMPCHRPVTIHLRSWRRRLHFIRRGVRSRAGDSTTQIFRRKTRVKPIRTETIQTIGETREAVQNNKGRLEMSGDMPA